ncbi:hypothetical protein BDZ94DRAFT_1302244 [Collybia nuda]|uniref:Uncharacterized protein n=1 Tax=Collybia nuda TaxID=64659 RepID=A0A9P6CDD1_9AGAR|nr:hypothetical protein BDZ94DRAFT_1302244 [Collybia nuda]
MPNQGNERRIQGQRAHPYNRADREDSARASDPSRRTDRDRQYRGNSQTPRENTPSYLGPSGSGPSRTRDRDSQEKREDTEFHDEIRDKSSGWVRSYKSRKDFEEFLSNTKGKLQFVGGKWYYCLNSSRNFETPMDWEKDVDYAASNWASEHILWDSMKNWWKGSSFCSMLMKHYILKVLQ